MKLFMSITCVPIYGLMFRILTRYNALYFGASWNSSQFYCLTSHYFGALSIFTGKADAKDFAVLVFTGNAHFQWIWSNNSWSRDSAPPMTGENHRLYNNCTYLILNWILCHKDRRDTLLELATQLLILHFGRTENTTSKMHFYNIIFHSPWNCTPQ